MKIAHLNIAFLSLSILLNSCSSESPEDLTPQVRNTSAVTSIELLDVGNTGTSSDLALKYQTPSSTTGIAELRAFLVKGSTNQITTEDAMDFPSDMYVAINPSSEVLGVGFKLDKLKTDVAGEDISFPGSYSVGVLSVPVDEGFRASLAFSSSATSVKISNEVVSYSGIITKGHEQNSDFPGAGAGGMSIDAEGNIFMADMGIAPIPGINDYGSNASGTNILKITPSKQVSILSTNYDIPLGNFLSKDGYLYQSGYDEGNLWRVDVTSGQRVQVETGIPLIHPDGIAEDDEGNLYIADCGANRILRVSPNGDAFPFPAMGRCPKGIVYADGFFYISYNNETGMIRRMDTEGNFEEVGAIPVSIPEDYILPYYMWLGFLAYHNDALYVAGTSTHKIYKVTLDGTVSTFAGTGQIGLQGGDALKSRLNRPMDIIVSNDGKSLFFNSSSDMEPIHVQNFLAAQIWELKLLED